MRLNSFNITSKRKVYFTVHSLGSRAPERWERWERVPSQFGILAATFGQPAEIASEISVHQPKLTTENGNCQTNWSKSPKKMHKNNGNRDNQFENYKYMFVFFNPGHRIQQPFLVRSQPILDFLEPSQGVYGLIVNDINEGIVSIMIVEMIYCPYQDSTRDIQSNIPLCLQELPLVLPLGTSSGEGVYLTVYHSSRPNTDTILHGKTVFRCLSPFAFGNHTSLETSVGPHLSRNLLKIYRFNW